MPVSPIVNVQDGIGPFVPTANGVNVTAGNTIGVKLADTTGVVDWFLRVLGTDELSTIPVLTGVNPMDNKVATPSTTATFTFPNGAGRAVLFESTVTGPGGPVTTTFALYSLSIHLRRVGAAGEQREGNTSFGWITIVNPIIRQGASVLYYNDSVTGPATGANNIQGAIDYLKSTGAVFTAGGDLIGTPSSQTVVGLRTRPVAATAPNTGEFLGWNGAAWTPTAVPAGFTAGQDLSGTPTSQTVIGLQTRPVLSTAPNSGEFLGWNGSAWTPTVVPPVVAGANVPIELVLVAGVVTTNSGTLIRIGGRSIDMTPFPATSAGLSRHVKFIATIESTVGTVTTTIQLYDVTDGAVITGTNMSTTNTTPTDANSGDLTVGSSNGNIRNDAVKQYEVQLSMTGGSPVTDRAVCINARLVITYS